MEHEGRLACSQEPATGPYPVADESISPPHHVAVRSILISYNSRLGLLNGLFLSGFATEFIRMPATCPAELILFDLIILMIFGEKYKLWTLIMQCSAASCHFIPSMSKYSPQHPSLKHPQSVFSRKCDSPSFTHTLEPACKIMVLCTLSFVF
jgi:hypothetical protein